MESVAAPLPAVIWRGYGSKTATQFQQLACCVIHYLAAFFGKVIHLAVQKCMITRKSMDSIATKQGSIG
jgi:hypothetical protein